MATTTSPDNIPAPSLTDPYALTQDMLALADGVQSALNRRANAYKGTISQRTAFTTAQLGTLWQDTDGIKMLWRKDGAAWVPAVWRWSGSTTQMNGFTQAPAGFEWYNITDTLTYTRSGGSWVVVSAINYFQAVHPVTPGSIQQSGTFYYTGLNTVTFPAGKFTSVPKIYLQSYGVGITGASIAVEPSTTSVTFQVWRLGAAPTTAHNVNVLAIQ